MEKYRAVKTEYNGIVFRSKSEALLARSFDLNGFLWEYEPYFGKSWKPDFRLVTNIDNRIDEYIVEYKPSMPTTTYINKTIDIYNSCYGYNRVNVPYLIFIIGSFYDKSNRRILYYLLNESLEEDKDITHDDVIFSTWAKAKEYRFDLLNGGR